jgi:hypothetical protein
MSRPAFFIGLLREYNFPSMNWGNRLVGVAAAIFAASVVANAGRNGRR